MRCYDLKLRNHAPCAILQTTLTNPSTSMKERRAFRAYFSYSHIDAEVDPRSITLLIKELEQRVMARLPTGEFKIWHDKQGIHIGDRWDSRLEKELHASDVLIVLLTPRWIGSEWCRKEYSIFEQVERERSTGDHVVGYVVPILVRDIERQKDNFTPEQLEIYTRITARQYQPATDFSKLSRATRTELLEGIADDIEGMIERRRSSSEKAESVRHQDNRGRGKREFDATAQNYREVDFVSDAEIFLDQSIGDADRVILAQFGFVEKLYVQSERGRIEFGVRRAFVSVDNEGPGALSKIDEFKKDGEYGHSYYVSRHESPTAITLCMNPPIGKTSLAKLALPPARNENYLSKIAKASSEVTAGQLSAQLVVSLSVEGLYIAGDRRYMSSRTEYAIKAIMEIAASKAAASHGETVDSKRQFHRRLPVKERPKADPQ
jgi:hypothetical protein